MHCPSCDSDKIVRNGIRENDKQNYRCQSCGRQFVENPSGHYRISDETCDLVDRLLLERIPLAGIARVAQVSESWLQKYVNAKYKVTVQQGVLGSELEGEFLAEEEALERVENGLVLLFEGRAAGANDGKVLGSLKGAEGSDGLEFDLGHADFTL